MENKTFFRKNVEMVKEEESKEIKWLGKSLIKKVGVEAGDIKNEDEFKKCHLLFVVKMYNDSLNEAAYFLSKKDVTPN